MLANEAAPSGSTCEIKVHLSKNLCDLIRNIELGGAGGPGPQENISSRRTLFSQTPVVWIRRLCTLSGGCWARRHANTHTHTLTHHELARVRIEDCQQPPQYDEAALES